MSVILGDTELHDAARQLVNAARQALPRVAWAAHAVEHGSAVMLVEVEVGADGPREVTLLLDAGGPEQTILAQILQPGEPVREAAA